MRDHIPGLPPKPIASIHSRYRENSVNTMSETGSRTDGTPPAGARMLHTMVRVCDLDRSLDFYVGMLGMKLLRKKDYPEGEFTLAFVGYADEAGGTVIELTHNWGAEPYDLGDGYGHIAIGVDDIYATCAALEKAGAKIVRPAGPMKADPAIVIAFVEDPDGYKVELIATDSIGR